MRSMLEATANSLARNPPCCSRCNPRYFIGQAGHDVFIDGYFYNGGFYRRHQLLGQIEEDGTFGYIKGHGQSTFPEHIVGHVRGLVLILKDGTLFNLVKVDQHNVEAL